jgi:hypothetical protein
MDSSLGPVALVWSALSAVPATAQTAQFERAPKNAANPVGILWLRGARQVGRCQ